MRREYDLPSKYPSISPTAPSTPAPIPAACAESASIVQTISLEAQESADSNHGGKVGKDEGAGGSLAHRCEAVDDPAVGSPCLRASLLFRQRSLGTSSLQLRLSLPLEARCPRLRLHILLQEIGWDSSHGRSVNVNERCSRSSLGRLDLRWLVQQPKQRRLASLRDEEDGSMRQ